MTIITNLTIIHKGIFALMKKVIQQYRKLFGVILFFFLKKEKFFNDKKPVA